MILKMMLGFGDFEDGAGFLVACGMRLDFHDFHGNAGF